MVLKPKTIYTLSAVIFTVLLFSIAISTVYFNQVANGWKNQDTIIDNITDDQNKLMYLLNIYSVNLTSDLTQCVSIVDRIGANASSIAIFDSYEGLLIKQMQSYVIQLRPLISITVSTLQRQPLLSISENIFDILQQFQSITQRLSGYINEQLSSENQIVFVLLFSFIGVLLAFLAFIHLQIFGRTIKTSQRLELNNLLLGKTLDERTAQLKDAERMSIIGQTASMVGHDIRNPLQAILSDAFLIGANLEEIQDNEKIQEAKESLNSIETNVTYINRIVADLQDLSRPLMPEYLEADLSEVICAVFTEIPIPLNIKLSINLGITKMKTDHMMIRRALTNLVSNAIQAMPDGGSLQIAVYRKQDRVFITVSDAGVGISEELKPKLFIPMTTTKSQGHGLGLAVVKRLVEALNGNITFDSKVGQGTTFIIDLPLKA